MMPESPHRRLSHGFSHKGNHVGIIDYDLLLYTALMADLYNLASHYWEGETISLHASQVDGDIFATFPIPFIRSNGTNTWDYVMDVANMLVDRKVGQPSIILNTDGKEVDLAAAPRSGHYIYMQQGMCDMRKLVFAMCPLPCRCSQSYKQVLLKA